MGYGDVFVAPYVVRLPGRACRCLHARVVLRNAKACATTQRHIPPVITVLDDTRSSWLAGEGCVTTRSHRAPAQGMLDDDVSSQTVREDA
jgi:hypothetical protein